MVLAARPWGCGTQPPLWATGTHIYDESTIDVSQSDIFEYVKHNV